MAEQLADPRRCGVYQLVRQPEEVERAALDAGLAIFRIDLAQVRNKRDFLARVAEALSFPDWFGGNWDALNDCLTDLDWLSTKTGYVLVFEKSDHFVFDEAIAVLGSAAEYWKEEGRPFWALIARSRDVDWGLSKWPSR